MPVQTPHPQYVAKVPIWQRMRDVYAGEDAVKAARTTYLPKPGGMTEEKYAAYVDRAMFFNGLRPTVEGFEGLVFRHAPEVKVPDAIAPHMDDITLDDTPLLDFAVRQFEEQLVVSRVGVLLDWSEARQRPYWVPYRAEQILNWRVGRVKDGLSLTRVVLDEMVEEVDPDDPWVPKAVRQLRVLLLEPAGATWAYRVELYREAKGAEGKPTGTFVLVEELQPTRRGTPLDFIPFMPYGPMGIETDIADPVLLDLVNVNLSQYRNYADLENGRHITGAPTPVVSGAPDDGTPLHIGSNVAWMLPLGGKADYLEFKGEGLGALEKAVEEKKALMASLGARLLQGDASRQETAEAVRLRHSGEHARLRNLATSATLALSAVLRWHLWWSTAVSDVNADDATITFATDYIETKLSPEEQKVLLLQWQAGAISHETYYHLLEKGGQTRKGVTFAEEQQALAAESPGIEPPAPIEPATGEGAAA